MGDSVVIFVGFWTNFCICLMFVFSGNGTFFVDCAVPASGT